MNDQLQFSTYLIIWRKVNWTGKDFDSFHLLLIPSRRRLRKHGCDNVITPDQRLLNSLVTKTPLKIDVRDWWMDENEKEE